MTSSNRLLILLLVVVAAVLWVKYARAQERHVSRKMSLAYIEDKAKVADAGDPKSIRALTDELFERSTLGDAASSLKDRVFRTELAFRQGMQLPISERAFVAALNEQVTPLQRHVPNGGALLRTTQGQVRLFREFVKRYVPHLSHGDNEEPLAGRLSDEMSPAEASFVAMQLVRQKLVNPEFQVSPEAWTAAVEARKARQPSGLGATTAVARTEFRAARSTLYSETLSHVALSLAQGLRDESSELVQGTHIFLDRIGLQR